MLSGRLRRRDLLRYGAMGLVTAFLPAWDRVTGDPSEIVSCVIHPAIGVARVGNSPDGYFIGPELPGPHPEPEGGFKDAAGRLKRQAARFRVYGLDASGSVVRELTSADASITWTAHLANKKAAWYEFETAFDIPEATGAPPSPGAPARPPLQTQRRNAGLTGADRSRLAIDPGPRSVGGTSVNADGTDRSFAFDSGRFFDAQVSLGELRTDGDGRLLVLGGFGKSAASTENAVAQTFANNDSWHDDVSDGPVEATVRIGERALPTTGAWVVVAPPNFAPGILSVVTMYDLIFEVATRLEPARAPRRPSFTRQIYPLLERHVQNQWVNAGFARQFGWGTAGSFLDAQVLKQLADSSPAGRSIRQQLFGRFRNPSYSASEPRALPPYYGDNMSLPAQSVRQWLAVLPIQYGWLRQWAEGDFDADWPVAGLQIPISLDDLPISEQPAALDRAALDQCLGGPFHPGCEMTWPMRIDSLYEAPFRLRRRIDSEPDWGETMTSTIALGNPGPLRASTAGDLTRWMAIPWQTDTSSCLSAYEPELDQYLPTFWPARVPNDVLTMDKYRTVMDPTAGREQRKSALNARSKWLRGLPEGAGDEQIARMNRFVADWNRYGVVVQRDGPTDDPEIPAVIWVETERDPGLDATSMLDR